MFRRYPARLFALTVLVACEPPAPVQVDIIEPEPGLRLPSTALLKFQAEIAVVEGDLFAVERDWIPSRGELGDDRWAPGSAVEVLSQPLAPGPYTITLEATSAEGGTGSAQATYPINHPPTAPAMGVNAVEITASGSVDVSLLETSEDVEGDPITYHYMWRRDDMDAGYIGDTLSAAMTRRGEVWSVAIAPHDGYDFGPSSERIEIWIVNAPPSAPGVRLVPDRPVANVDDLHCVIDEPSTDEDGDPFWYVLSWTADGQPYPSAFPEALGPSRSALDGDTVPAQDLALASRFTCSVVAYDRFDPSEAGSAEVEVDGG